MGATAGEARGQRPSGEHPRTDPGDVAAPRARRRQAGRDRGRHGGRGHGRRRGRSRWCSSTSSGSSGAAARSCWACSWWWSRGRSSWTGTGCSSTSSPGWSWWWWSSRRRSSSSSCSSAAPARLRRPRQQGRRWPGAASPALQVRCRGPAPPHSPARRRPAAWNAAAPSASVTTSADHASPSRCTVTPAIGPPGPCSRIPTGAVGGQGPWPTAGLRLGVPCLDSLLDGSESTDAERPHVDRAVAPHRAAAARWAPV